MKTFILASMIALAAAQFVAISPVTAQVAAQAAEGSGAYDRGEYEREGFVAVEPGQGETVNGGRLMLIAYGVLWLLMAGYVVGISRRQNRVASEFDELRKRLAEVDDDLQRHEKKVAR